MKTHIILTLDQLTDQEDADMGTKRRKARLTPPDRKRCQADIHPAHSFMTLGPRPGWERCTNKAAVIVRELKPGKDGHKGSMSLCVECFAQFCMRECPTDETHAFEEIKT